MGPEASGRGIGAREEQHVPLFDFAQTVASPIVPQPVPSDRERIETAIIKSLISSYFDIVRKTIQDSVPKAIMYFLVNQTKNELQSELVSTLYKEDLFESLLKESDDIAQRRQTSTQMLEVLRRAMDITNEIRDFNFLSNK
eukprot:TRINITY_DN7868_c0_g1_i3.p1 TRINITY_DN7868_c0_g1~~TRINITY_DN7868_c0_g1_i3.p1  ORF type:complete len:157 (-),score=46.24 TRINITY_DN7868_c0_g1_i3:24-446(-)